MKDTQCILAYTSLYVNPDGLVRPCCVADNFEEKLQWSDYDNVMDLLNSKQFKKLREDMDNGITPKPCDICFKKGNTLKDVWNNNWKEKFDDPELFNEDYSINKLQYLDVRFSNLCNFKCRMCGPTLSSSWLDDLIEIYGVGMNNLYSKHYKIGEDPVNKFSDEDLNYIEHLYIAGGEPFINEDVFKLIDRFSEDQAKNINVYINSNLSNLKYKQIDILEALKKFKNVIIGCSCDGYGKVGEFQRTGFVSEKFFDNIKKIADFNLTHPNVNAEIEYTITMMNVFHTFDFIDYVLDNNYTKKDLIHIHWATTPYWFAVGAAPTEFKNKVIDYINENLSKKEYYSKTVSIMNDFINHLKIDSSIIRGNQTKNDLKEYLEKLDSMRNTDYKEICPWIEIMF
jgi:MoaA/NifB/PqqE/SkfB family radical SAM enzyme